QSRMRAAQQHLWHLEPLITTAPRVAPNGFSIRRHLARNSPDVNPLCACLMPLTCTVVPRVLAWRVSMEERKGLETDEFCGRRHGCLSTPRCCVDRGDRNPHHQRGTKRVSRPEGGAGRPHSSSTRRERRVRGRARRG